MLSVLELDKKLFLALNFDGGLFWDEFFWMVSGKLTWIPLYILMAVLIWRRYGWKYTLLSIIIIALTVVAVDQACNFFKNFFPKLRPTHNPDFEGVITLVRGYRGYMYGTVSAHAATTFGIMTISSSLIRARWYTVLSIVWALLVSYSRIYIGAHYPMDIFLGAVLGIVAGVLAVRLLRLLTDYIERRIKMKPDRA